MIPLGMLRTKLNMDSVRSDVANELASILEAGVPLVYRENGIIVEVKKLDNTNAEFPTEKHYVRTAAE